MRRLPPLARPRLLRGAQHLEPDRYRVHPPGRCYVPV